MSSFILTRAFLYLLGEPAKEEYRGGRIRVFITNNESKRNLAVLLELQDYSPVTLLKDIYGPTIGRATVLRDRNQTIALYVSSQPTSKFSSVLTAHGSGRWIHRDSTFDPGAYLLVTLPFPKRKAVDMKIKLHSDSLQFAIPENEKLYSDLALNAILPAKIMHLGVDRSAEAKNKDDKMYSKIRILRFRYFLFNDTYLAAAESHLSPDEELQEYMPKAKTQESPSKQKTKISSFLQSLRTKNEIDSDVSDNNNNNLVGGKVESKFSLDEFFQMNEKASPSPSTDTTKLKSESSSIAVKQISKVPPPSDDALSNAEKAGLL